VWNLAGWYFRTRQPAALDVLLALPLICCRYVDRTSVEGTPSVTSAGDGAGAPLLGGTVHPLALPAQSGGVMPKALPYLKKVWGI
jgi:hypothetical protein